MLREIKGSQRLSRFLGFKVTGTGTAAINQGAADATLTDNGTGDYTITFVKPFQRAPIVTVAPATTGIHCEIASASATAVRIKTFAVADGTTATDAVFHAQVLGYDSADET